ncbi:CxxH/CxxC protein [Sporosarcina sp. OR05]|uniref:CxxH/CxxC protein n=1 Tax=Sporosarcina sp. OR05 TaxID=2969819 RepID=UPI00352B1E44
MKIQSCKNHIDQAIDDFIATEETFPILEEIKTDEKISTTCTYCDTPVRYIVANE